MSATVAPIQSKAPSSGPDLGTGSPLVPFSAITFQAGAIRTIELSGPAGRLEAVVNEGASGAQFAALVCHPHPLFGGSLHNKVVYHAIKALNDPAFGLGFPVLRFNFRGAGLSEGTHDGEAEVGDVLAALDWLDQEFQRPVVLAGFSFGAAMALRACYARQRGEAPTVGASVQSLVALGLPTQIESPAHHYSFLNEIGIPKLFVSGDRDQFSTPEQLIEIAAAAAKPTRLILLPGADHFFSGQMEPMQRAIASWVKEQLQ